MVVADFEAGIGTVLRLEGNPVDVVVIVVEPTAKSLEVGRRAAETVREGKLGHIVVAANRVRDDTDEQRIRDVFPDMEVVLVPDDPAIVAAERSGVSPLDASPDAPAVRVLVDLANRLLTTG